MTQIRFVLIGAFAIILTILSQQVTPLKCWSCTTLLKKACGEPFEPKKLHTLDFPDCPWKCGTLIFNNSDGVKSWNRFCAQNQTDFDQTCNNKTDKISCESCSKDGCNAAVKYGPIALFIIVPMAVAKIFLF